MGVRQLILADTAFSPNFGSEVWPVWVYEHLM